LVFQKLSKILEEFIDIDGEDITLETELMIESEIKAVDIARIVIECEKQFRITIHDEDVHTFRCVNDLVEYISEIKSNA
jgi:acyl carrier protein